jgi:predicted Fe-Mo cluster-binding NifX family protein
MKIAVSAMSASENAAVDPRFGRCAFFAVYDTAQDDWGFIENDGIRAGGGAGLAAAQQIIDNGVSAVITGNMGPNAFDVLHGDEINIYHCAQGSLKDAVRGYSENKLEEITASGPAHAGTKGSSF